MQYPEQQARRYARVLKRLADELQRAVTKRGMAFLEIYNEFYDNTNRDWDHRGVDIDDPEMKRIFQEMNADMKDSIDRSRLRELVAAQLGGVQSAINTQFETQIERMTGITPLRREKKLAKLIEDRVQENVDLIVTLPDKHFNRIEGLVDKAINEGWSTQRLQDAIPDAGASAEFDAERIARDQIGKASADLTEQRFGDAGMRTFVWSTAGDVRVRGEDPDDQHNHADLDGHRFSWADGSPTTPGGGEDADGNTTSGWSETGYPGRDILCRCVPEVPQAEIDEIITSGARL